MINQYEVPAYSMDELPEIKEELESVSPTLNIIKSIQCLVKLTRKKVIQHDLRVVKRCFLIAENFYCNGNRIVKDTIENVFIYSFSSARGKAQADSLRKTRQDTPAKKIFAVGENFLNEIKIVPSAQLALGDLYVCEAGDIIPIDGEIVKGIATIDESAITGESAPVIREAGGDKSSVTGGTKVLSDKIEVKVTTTPGESFLDKMIALVEGASRQKTPNEIALTILLAGFTLIFILYALPCSLLVRTPIHPLP